MTADLSNQIDPGLRILEIGRDPLFTSVLPDNSTWVRIGAPLEPYSRHLRPPPERAHSISSVLPDIIGGRFGVIVLPAIRARPPGPTDGSVKALLRRTAILTARSAWAARIAGSLLRLPSTPHMLHDVSDYPTFAAVSVSLFPGAAIYAKRELLEDDVTGDPPAPDLAGVAPARVVYAPMPLDASVYVPYASSDKPTDVFFAGSINSPAREAAVEVLTGLAGTGVEVDLCTEPVGFMEYVRRMSESKLTISPKGIGEHCYRHYEALLVGSVPVISRPERPVHYDLTDGETALFYDPGSLEETIEKALSAPGALSTVADAGHRLAIATHDKPALVERYLRLLEIIAPV